MAQIEFRLPSALPYAYVSVTGEPGELEQINFHMLASLYANSLNAFQAAEVEAAKLIVQGGPAKPAEHKVGDTVTVGGLEFTKHSESPFEGDAVAEVKDSLGATEIDNVNEAPYKAPAPAAKAKPWETKKPAAKLNIDPDFF